MLVDTLWDKKSETARYTKTEAVIRATMSRTSQQNRSSGLEVWTYFQPCSEVSLANFIKDWTALPESLPRETTGLSEIWTKYRFLLEFNQFLLGQVSLSLNIFSTVQWGFVANFIKDCTALPESGPRETTRLPEELNQVRLKVRYFQKKIGIIYRLKQICRFTNLKLVVWIFTRFLLHRTKCNFKNSSLR